MHMSLWGPAVCHQPVAAEREGPLCTLKPLRPLLGLSRLSGSRTFQGRALRVTAVGAWWGLAPEASSGLVLVEDNVQNPLSTPFSVGGGLLGYPVVTVTSREEG